MTLCAARGVAGAGPAWLASLFGNPTSHVGWLQCKHLHVSIREIGPVMNGKPPMNRNLHPASDGIVLMIIHLTGRKIPNPMKLGQKVVSCALGQSQNDFHHLKLDEQAILYCGSLPGKSAMEVVEFYPMGRIGIFNFLRQLLLESIVSRHLQGDHVRDQLPLLLRRELNNLIL